MKFQTLVPRRGNPPTTTLRPFLQGKFIIQYANCYLISQSWVQWRKTVHIFIIILLLLLFTFLGADSKVRTKFGPKFR
jgi:hypothetical protein